MSDYNGGCANTCYGCQSLGLRMVELQDQLAAMTERAEKAERERNEYASLLGEFARTQAGKDYIFANPIGVSASEKLNQFALQQKIEVLEKFHSDTDDVLLDGEKVTKLEVLDAITHRINQLRAQLEEG